jgi:hypothetical protein
MDTSYLTTQVNTIIGQLHSIFDEIGVPRNERESRETELFSALSETLHNQLRLVNGYVTKSAIPLSMSANLGGVARKLA